MPTAVVDKAARRREQKRAWAERHYAANKDDERERCRSAKRQARSVGPAPERGKPPSRPMYPEESYVAEWVFLTWGGRRSDDILAASAPSIDWFNEHVLPKVSRSICATCDDMFDPRVAGSLTRCSKTCGLV